MRKQRYARYPSACGCGVEACLEVIGGKWKGLLLHQLIQHGTQRFGQLRSLKPNLSARILTAQLQELEEDGIVVRKAYAVVPPKVEYSLSEYGQTLVPLIQALQAWGDEDRRRRGSRTAKSSAAPDLSGAHDSVGLSSEAVRA